MDLLLLRLLLEELLLLLGTVSGTGDMAWCCLCSACACFSSDWLELLVLLLLLLDKGDALYLRLLMRSLCGLE